MIQAPSYNVLTQPWISVERVGGGREKLGVSDTLARAHMLRGITESSPLYEFAILRFLITFLTDLYRPERWQDIEEIIQSGCFDHGLLQNYADQWSDRFDLFDAAHPFLQVPFDASDDKTSSCAVLFSEWPTGNNHIFFNHRLERSYAFSPEECVKALCGAPLYTTRWGNKKGKGVTGTPPVFFLYAGRTLFETLVMSMTPREAQPQIDLDDPPVQWRDLPVRADFKPCAKVSQLSGLLSRPLDIQLIPECADDGSIIVRRIQYGRGWDYDAAANWHDPHIALREDQKPLKGQEGRAVWRDIGTILRADGQPAWAHDIRERMSLLSDPPAGVPLCAYVPILRFKGTAFFITGWFDEPMSVHSFLFNDEEKAALLREAITMVENVGNRLTGVFSWTNRQMEQQNKKRKSVDETTRFLSGGAFSAYLNQCREYLFSGWIPLLGEAVIQYEWAVPLREAAGEQILVIALRAFDDAVNAQAQTAYLLKWRALARPFLNGQIKKILRKEGWLHDDANAQIPPA